MVTVHVARVLLVLAFVIAFWQVKARRLRCPAKTSLATFNGAFVPFFPGAGAGDPEIAERTQLLIQQIDSSDVDILCLQEILDASIQRQMYTALKDQYPYILSALDLSAEGEGEERACALEELQQIGVCAQTQCPGLTGDTFLGCFVLRCSNTTASLSPRCRDCANLHFSSNNQAQCLTLAASRFETSYGLMLLSKKELQDGRASGFNPQSQFRGYLEASVDGVGHLICTHLTSLVSTQIYAGPPLVSPFLYPNYDAQQYDELTTLFEVATSVENPILMGDFNNGPASPGENFAWELPFHYGLMVARGFVSPYVLEDGRCTFCVDNPSVDFPSNLVIDHVYLTTDAYKGRVLSAKRFLDDVSTVNGSALSDHYGVVVTLKDIRYNCRWWENKRFYCPAERLLLEQLPPPQDELDRLCTAASG